MDDDDNSRLGMWIGIGAALLVALGTVLTLVWSTLDDDASTRGAAGASTSATAATKPVASAAAGAATAAAAATAPAVAAAPAAAATSTATTATAASSSTVAATPTAGSPDAADATVDIPLTGDLLAKVYFDSGKATFGADGGAAIDKAVAAIGAGGARKVVLSGFHDLSGNAAQNAELAKNRAKAVREALKAKGIAAERIVLRKPAETGAGGAPEEARRVEIRLVD